MAEDMTTLKSSLLFGYFQKEKQQKKNNYVLTCNCLALFAIKEV